MCAWISSSSSLSTFKITFWPTSTLIFSPLGLTFPPAIVISMVSAVGSASVADGLGVRLGVGVALAEAAGVVLAVEVDGLGDGVAVTSGALVQAVSRAATATPPAAHATLRLVLDKLHMRSALSGVEMLTRRPPRLHEHPDGPVPRDPAALESRAAAVVAYWLARVRGAGEGPSCRNA